MHFEYRRKSTPPGSAFRAAFERHPSEGLSPAPVLVTDVGVFVTKNGEDRNMVPTMLVDRV